jgi:hypothetical protein
MIVLFTDFGLHGPYRGQMKVVLQRIAPGTPVIDLFADAPIGNPRASAYLLAAYAVWFPAGTIFLAVVDLGVGGMRPAVIVKADGRRYVGPGNGLFEFVQRRAGEALSWDITGGLRACRRAFTGVTCLPPLPPCWRAVTRRPSGRAWLGRIGESNARMTSGRSSTLIISAMPDRAARGRPAI